jgi:hypothetical protein
MVGQHYVVGSNFTPPLNPLPASDEGTLKTFEGQFFCLLSKIVHPPFRVVLPARFALDFLETLFYNEHSQTNSIKEIIGVGFR